PAVGGRPHGLGRDRRDRADPGLLHRAVAEARLVGPGVAGGEVVGSALVGELAVLRLLRPLAVALGRGLVVGEAGPAPRPSGWSDGGGAGVGAAVRGAEPALVPLRPPAVAVAVVAPRAPLALLGVGPGEQVVARAVGGPGADVAVGLVAVLLRLGLAQVVGAVGVRFLVVGLRAGFGVGGAAEVAHRPAARHPPPVRDAVGARRHRPQVGSAGRPLGPAPGV